jgi:hypothetical protein
MKVAKKLSKEFAKAKTGAPKAKKPKVKKALPSPDPALLDYKGDCNDPVAQAYADQANLRQRILKREASSAALKA